MSMKLKILVECVHDAGELSEINGDYLVFFHGGVIY